MENVVYVNDEEISDYLRSFGAGRDSHDTELSEAVRLRRFFDKQIGNKHLIAIPIEQDGFQRLQNSQISKNEVLRDYRKQDTEVDFIIIDELNSMSPHGGEMRAHVVQMKRLTDRQFKGDLTSSIIEVIKKAIAKRYSKDGYLTLYIPVNLSPQEHSPNWKQITTFIEDESSNPFVQVMVGPFKDKNGNEYLVQVFPSLIFPQT